MSAKTKTDIFEWQDQAIRRIAALEAALEGAEAWLDRWATHVGKCLGGDRCTCGLTAIRYEARAALAPAPAPGGE